MTFLSTSLSDDKSSTRKISDFPLIPRAWENEGLIGPNSFPGFSRPYATFSTGCGQTV